MDSDVRRFVTWNKALDLELPGGYMHAVTTIPGYDYLLQQKGASETIRNNIVEALSRAEKSAHQRRVSGRAVARRSLALAARKKNAAEKKAFQARALRDMAHLNVERAQMAVVVAAEQVGVVTTETTKAVVAARLNVGLVRRVKTRDVDSAKQYKQQLKTWLEEDVKVGRVYMYH